MDYKAIIKIVAYMECDVFDAPDFQSAVDKANDLAESACIPPMGHHMASETYEIVAVREEDED